MLKNKKAVIFDLDGTLIDSMWIWKDIDIEFLAERGHGFPDDLQDQIEGLSFTDTALYCIDRFRLSESVEEIKEIWVRMAKDRYADEVGYKPGADLFLQYCKGNGIPMGIATSNSRELVSTVSNAIGLDDYIDVVMTSCDVKIGKPAPDVYLEVARKLGVLPKDCLVFEDIPIGIIAGKSAGMTVCAIEDDFSKHKAQEKRFLADYYIHSYDQVLDGTYESHVLPAKAVTGCLS